MKIARAIYRGKRKLRFFVILSVTLFSLFYNLNHFSSEGSLQVLINFNKSSNLKYLLVWTRYYKFSQLGEGINYFTDRRCSFSNCYLSTNRELLANVANFDAILFNARELTTFDLPQSRSPHQKYIFTCSESSENYPVCTQKYINYFNWTWCYKLNSDEIYGYLSIRDKNGTAIGPKEVMYWEKVEAMMPINDTLKAKLSTKKIAAAWFVSNCNTNSGRDEIAKQLQIELAKYGMQVDIYGSCGTKKCPRDNMAECLRKLETDYYFYLSFENSFADDYVTEKLLHALQHYAVPVVYGGANYTRFMPDGIYLSAVTTSIKELAKKMANAIEDKQKYYEFFKWHNHYSYHDPGEAYDTDPYCKLCELLNKQEEYLRTSVYDMLQWWNPQPKCGLFRYFRYI